MGAAAYRRGSQFLSRLLDAEAPDAVAAMLGELTAHSDRNATAVPFAPTVIRPDPDPSRRTWHFMNREAGGWGSSSREYGSLWVIARTYRIAFVGIGRDDTSFFYRVAPLGPRKETDR